MKKINFNELQQLIEGGCERRDLEFKESYAWKEKDFDYIQATTIRGIIAMSNIRGGGVLVVGVKEVGNVPKLDGLNEVQFQSFQKTENVIRIIDEFIYTRTNIEIVYTQDEENNYYIVFRIAEFEVLPLITKKEFTSSGKCIIEVDTIYSRTKSGAISSKRAGYFELEECIEIAIDKGRRKIEQRGISSTKPSDTDLFNEEIKDIT